MAGLDDLLPGYDMLASIAVRIYPAFNDIDAVGHSETPYRSIDGVTVGACDKGIGLSEQIEIVGDSVIPRNPQGDHVHCGIDAHTTERGSFSFRLTMFGVIVPLRERIPFAINAIRVDYDDSADRCSREQFSNKAAAAGTDKRDRCALHDCGIDGGTTEPAVVQKTRLQILRSQVRSPWSQGIFVAATKIPAAVAETSAARRCWHSSRGP
jgi:hypothetical protein